MNQNAVHAVWVIGSISDRTFRQRGPDSLSCAKRISAAVEAKCGAIR